MSIDKDYQISDLTSSSTFYDWFIKENTEIIEKLNMLKVFNIEGVNGITAPVASSGVASIGLSGKVDNGISFNGPVYFNAFTAIPNIAIKVPQINSTVGGFTFGTPVRVYYDVDTSTIKYEGAKASDPDQAEVMGIVSEITSTYAYVTMLGKIDGDFSAVNTRGIGLTAGWIYFVDPGITGNITDIETETIGTVSKPVIMGISGNSGLVLQMRGNYISGVTTNNYSQVSTLTSNFGSYTTASEEYTELSLGSIISVKTIDSSDITDFLIDAGTRFIIRLQNANTQERTYLYLSTVNDGVNVFFRRAEDDIYGVILDKKIISGKIVLTILNSGYTDIFNDINSNGLFYLNPEFDGESTVTPNAPQYGNEYCSSGVLLYNKFNTFSIFYNNRVTPCTSTSLQASTSQANISNSSTNYLINGNFNVWQRDIAKNSADTSVGNLIFADMWRRHDGICGGSASKNYYIIRRDFDEYQTEIEGNPQYYIDVKAIGLSAMGISGTSGGYTAYDHLMIGHVIPGAKKFDSNNINFNFYAKASHTGYDLDVYASRYSGQNLLNYQKIGTANLNNTWQKYEYNHSIYPLGNTGINLDVGDDYFEIGLDFIPLIERQNVLGITLGQNNFVSISSFSAGINANAPSVYPEYNEQLEYCQQFYYTTYDKNQTIGSITMVDSTNTTQNTENIFILPNKTCYLLKWPSRMRAVPSIELYSPMSGMISRAYNKTASNSSLQVDTINTSGIGGRDGSGASIIASPSIYGTNICINNGIINYDEIYFHIIANSDFVI